MSLLVTTVNGRKDKNDVLLQELVNAKNWKQALTHCEKRLKKGEKDERLSLNKAFILLRMADREREDQGVAEIRLLVDRKPPITDTEVLVTVENVAKGFPERAGEASKWVDSMWERAASQLPKDENLLALWFETKFSARNYKAAQRAAMVYSRNFLNRRRPFYWLILTNHFVSMMAEIPERERAIYAELAYKQLDKAATLVPTDSLNSATANLSLESTRTNGAKEDSDSSRALQNVGDLQLLVQVYRSQGRYKEALAILNDPHTGVSSPIGMSSWELTRERIMLYSLCNSWEDQWQNCYDLLMGASPVGNLNSPEGSRLGIGKFGDDHMVWSELLHAHLEIRTAENASRTKAVILSYLGNGRKSRNARLAMIEFYAKDSIPIERDPDNLLSALLAYYYDYSTRSVCFEDLRYAYLLSIPEQREFLQQLAKHAESIEPHYDTEHERIEWLATEINCLKQDYTLIVSVNEEHTDQTLLEHFISNCLRLYNLSLPLGKELPATERRPGDDAAILAAMGCIHLFDRGNEKALLRCALILEALLSNSSHNYDALLLIIRVYFALGVIAKGMVHYIKLDIKHIQYLTNSWILFTRISTIHPHSFRAGTLGNKPMPNPATLIKSGLTWVAKNDMYVKSGIKKFIEHDSLVNLMKHLEYAKTTGAGPLTKASLLIEIQRISRFGYAKRDRALEELLGPIDFMADDVRNTSSFPNYEAYGQSPVHELVQPGPNPGKPWLFSQLQTIDLAQALSGHYPGALAEGNGIGTDDSTIEERTAAVWNRYLIKLLSVAVENDIKNRVMYGMALSGLLAALESKSPPWLKMAQMLIEDPTYSTLRFSSALAVPHWQHFHALYTFMDQCCLTVAFLYSISTLNKVMKFFPDQKALDRVKADFEKTTLDMYRDFSTAAKKLQGMLKEAEPYRAVRELCLGREGDSTDIVGIELRKLVGTDDWMTKLGAEWLESWRESLDGLIQAKPIYDRWKLP